MTSRTLQGKTALIAGGSKNLGAAFAKDLAEHGIACVGIHYNSASSLEEAEATKKQVQDAGTRVFLYQADLADPGAVEDLFQSAKADMGGIDLAINCAGVLKKNKIIDMSEDDLDATLNINIRAGFLFIKHAGIALNDNGNILTIGTSLVGGFQADYGLYAGSKAALEHFTRAAAKELGHRGISANCLAPGPINNSFFFATSPQAAANHLKSLTALGDQAPVGLSEMEDIAPWARFLATEGWWMTGQTILLNGGLFTK
ncbi:Short-chain type dehydrogenase/reductase [Hondaea fermentalgiana]|uniref:Short-chain type dehydrogenase/reductase n=1 Tax=Hondaea fermentalgiana TaxID=2315210 RepID=A0A2R5GH63_9STRA|nr:Short-chain type dehydrogenase/reductase [Hondaea fermentalgiana]|eukprot:GBG30232.1 Short-chain type dehydrogenase/reductase [Hondaea fermentalgiana]